MQLIQQCLLYNSQQIDSWMTNHLSLMSRFILLYIKHGYKSVIMSLLNIVWPGNVYHVA